MARAEYSDALKAEVMAALLSGQSPSIVADRYNIPHGTVRAWSAKERNALRGSDGSYLDNDQQERIGTLILDNVESMLETTKEMMHVFRDKTWLKEQSASELAVLFGVIADKTYRLLEALPNGSSEASEPET